MATFDFSVLGSPEQAYNLAQKRVQVFKDAGQQIGEAANKGMAALADEKVKNQVISAITSKWSGLKGREEDLKRMDSKTLAGQVFVMNTIDNYIKTKKAEHPDEGIAFSGPETFFGTDPSHLEQVLKAIDGQAKTAGEMYSKKASATQQAAMAGSGTREQAATAGIEATPGVPLQEGSKDVAELYSPQAALDASKQRATALATTTGTSNEKLMFDYEKEKNDLMSNKNKLNYDILEKKNAYKKWEKSVKEGLPYDEKTDIAKKEELRKMWLLDKEMDTLVKDYVKKINSLRSMKGTEKKTSLQSSSSSTVQTATGGTWDIKAK